MADLHMDMDNARHRMQLITGNIGDYSDAELRDIKNTADVFSMHIRMELAARDARAIDQILETDK